MRSRSSSPALGRVSAWLVLFSLVVGGSAGSVQAFSGTIDYTGDVGPITARRPLCLCVYTMPDLSNRIGCAIYEQNDVSYVLNNLADKDYYLIAFVDVHINERLDNDEPFQIYHGRGSKPADPLNGKSTASDIDFIFGDENVPPTPTPSETRTSSPTVTPSPTAADTPTAPASTPTAPAAVVGDCDGDGSVTVAELVRAVGIALETQPVASCPAADRDGDGAVRIEELIAALNAALAAAG